MAFLNLPSGVKSSPNNSSCSFIFYSSGLSFKTAAPLRDFLLT
jgi:hypothetical protein